MQEAYNDLTAFYVITKKKKTKEKDVNIVLKIVDRVIILNAF